MNAFIFFGTRQMLTHRSVSCQYLCGWRGYKPSVNKQTNNSCRFVCSKFSWVGEMWDSFVVRRANLHTERTVHQDVVTWSATNDEMSRDFLLNCLSGSPIALDWRSHSRRVQIGCPLTSSDKGHCSTYATNSSCCYE